MPYYFGPSDSQGQDQFGWEMDDLPPFLSELQESRGRAEQLNRIRIFLDSAAKREAELKELLEWLSFTKEAFDRIDHDRKSNNTDSLESIDAMEVYLNKLMFDMDCGISRLSVLWKSICQMNNRKRKKEETALPKGNTWTWWRESKVDAKAVSRIQELHPPAVEALLEDASLATKCASELSFILDDIQRSLSGNKTMHMVFSFVQMGLQNINEAFQKRSKDNKTDKDFLSAKDNSSKIAYLTAQLGMVKGKVALLEDTVTHLKEQKQALLFRVRNIPVYSHPKGGPLPEPAMVHQTIPDLTAEQAETLQTSTTSVPRPTTPQQKCPMEPNSTDTTESDTTEENTESLSEQIKKKSAHLLQEFRETVFKILENSMEFNDKQSERDKSQNIVRLYQFLQGAMHDCFNNIMIHIRGKCKDEIIELPFQEMYLLESELWDSPDANPSQMLIELSEIIKRHDKSIKNAGASLKSLFSLQDKDGKDFEQKHHPGMAQVLDMFKNINDMEKQQACKMRLTLDSLWTMHRQIQEKERMENIAPPPVPPMPMIPAKAKVVKEMTNNKPTEVLKEHMKIHVVVKDHTMVETPEAIKEPVQQKLDKVPEFSGYPRPQRLSPVRDSRMSASPNDYMDLYTAEMAEEGQRLVRSQPLAQPVYVINVPSQRVNVKLLEQALFRGTISPQLYRLIRDTILQTLASVNIRLGCIMQRFLRQERLRKVCKILNARLVEARALNDGHSIRKCYIYLQKMEKLQEKVSDSGCTKQASVDCTRKNSIARMLYLFKQIKLDYGINLAAPYYCSVPASLPYLIVTTMSRKLQWSLSSSQRQPRDYSNSQRPAQCSLFSPLPPFLPAHEHYWPTRESKRADGAEEASFKRLWQQIQWTDNSMMLASKQCAVPPLPFPVLPRLLEMDVNEGRRKARQTLQDRMNGVLGQILKSREDT